MTVYSTTPGPTGNNGNLPPGYSLGIAGAVLAPKACFPRRVPGCKAAIYTVEDAVKPLVGKAPSQLPLRKLIQRRGEFIGIIILCALILSAIVVAIPFFALYAIIWTPLQTEVHTTILFPDPNRMGFVQQGNASVVFQVPRDPEQSFMGVMSPNVTVSQLYAAGSLPCPSDSRMLVTDFGKGEYSNQSLTVAECPLGWDDIANISISITSELAYIIYASPGQGDLQDTVNYSELIPILPGAQLFALLTWTTRQIYATPSSRLFGLFTPARTVLSMDVNTLLHANNLNAPTAPSSTLLLVVRDSSPTKLLKLSAPTALDGISSVGGLWTFVNGVFVLFFGANFMYFAFGRRPLSALGIAHLFQRRTLTRRWHEDFPALQTEGGRPGSESAGIVAFIRERLVDIDNRDELCTDADVEELTQDIPAAELQPKAAMSSTEGDGSLAPATSEASADGAIELAYQLDEIPLFDLQHLVGGLSWYRNPTTAVNLKLPLVKM
ncbi:hypothetical protein DFH06DRAFT_1372298 [Mycena polygramma]|nr:hypothetical protein DFH06DRAFT_1372298 [Mycena polygramma]